MENNQKLYEKVEIIKKESSEIEIKWEIQNNAILPYRKRAIKKLGEGIKIDGFRKGYVPEKMLADKIGEQKILEETAGILLAETYPQIAADYKLKVIGRPRASVTKLAPGNPIGFAVSTAVEPDINLPDYKRIAKETIKNLSDQKIEVSDEEVNNAVKHIIKNLQENKNEENEKEKLEFNDEFVKKLGNFKNAEDFKIKLKENLRREKEIRAMEKKRVEFMDKIIQESAIILPNILVEDETEKMLAQFKDDIAKMKLPFEEYLEKIKKSEDDLRREWKTDADKRAKLQLVLSEIARKENIAVPEENIKMETERLLERYKEASPENVKLYVETVLTNEKVFQLLENQ